MEKVCPWCGQPSDQGQLENRTESSTKHSCQKLLKSNDAYLS